MESSSPHNNLDMDDEDVEEYDQMSSQQLEILISEGGLSQTTMKELLDILIRKNKEKKANLNELETIVAKHPTSSKKLFMGEERKKAFEEWGKLCDHKSYNPDKNAEKLFLSPGIDVFKKVDNTNVIMAPLTPQESKFGMEQNYAIPIRSLHPINGKRFCKTGMYVIAETSFANAKQAAYINLAKIKQHLTGDRKDQGVCEHLENFEIGEYYNINETVPLEIYSTSVYPADQIRFYYRRTRPCLGARRKLKSETILRDYQDVLDGNWDTFESVVATFDECVPPDRNMWVKLKEVNQSPDFTCTCQKCVKKHGPGGKVFRDKNNLNRHLKK